jgi:ABC-type taurine transport system substrate-binding protein
MATRSVVVQQKQSAHTCQGIPSDGTHAKMLNASRSDGRRRASGSRCIIAFNSGCQHDIKRGSFGGSQFGS